MTEVPLKLRVKAWTIVPPLHQMASKEETRGRDLDPGWLQRVVKDYPDRKPTTLLEPCIFDQQRLPRTLRSRSVRIGVVRFEKVFSRQPVG